MTSASKSKDNGWNSLVVGRHAILARGAASAKARLFSSSWLGREGRGGNRRLMSVLRMAHKTLGMSRKRLGLGMLGCGRISACAVTALAFGLLAPSFSFAAVSGTDNGSPLGAGSIAISSSNCQSVATKQAVVASAATNAVAIGCGTVVSSENAVAFGNLATAVGPGDLAFGWASYAAGGTAGGTGSPATALGAYANATGTYSTAIGSQAAATAANSTALGAGAKANNARDVALGYTSVTAATVATANVTINGHTYAFAGVAPRSTVSVGSVGNERTITNVAAGRVTAESTDAVNGSQLFATNQEVGLIGTQVNNLGSSVATSLGGGSTYVNGVWTNPSYTIQGNTYNNVGGALGGINTSLTTITNNVNNGVIGPVRYSNSATPTTPNGGTVTDNLTLVGTSPSRAVGLHNVANGTVTSTSTDAVNGSQLYSLGSNVASSLGGGSSYTNGVWTGPSYTIQGNTYTNVGSALGSVNTSLTTITNNVTNGAIGPVRYSNSATPTTPNGGTITNSLTLVGISSSQAVSLHNVAAGTVTSTSTDAVNGSQLHGLGSEVAGSLGGGSTYVNGVWTGPSYTVQGNTYNNVGGALGGINTSLTTITNNVTNGAIGPVRYSNSATPTTPNGGTVTDNLTLVGTNPGKAVGLHNVANGAVMSTSTDAVNGSQLHGLGSDVASSLGGGSTYVNGVWTGPSYTIQGNTYNNVGGALGGINTSLTNITNNVTNGAIGPVRYSNSATPTTPNGGTITDSLTLVGTSSTQAVSLHNVANGAVTSTSTDAVNGSQLHGLGSEVAGSLGGGSTYVNGVWTGPTYNIRGGNYNNVGGALGAIDNSLSTITTNITNLGNDALLWDSAANGGLGAFSAKHGGAGPNIITNVAPGALTSTSTDAVNGSQLYATNQLIGEVANNSVQYDNVGKTSVTLGGSGAVAPVSLHNVANGAVTSTSTDAVNGSQLHGLGSEVAGSLGGGSTYVNGVWTGPSYTIQGNTYNNVGGALGGINTSLTNINTNVTNLGNDALLWDSAANGGLGAFSAKHGGAGPNIITNVAPGALTSTSTDAVNGSQLYATNQLIGEVADNSVQYDNAGKTSVTLGGSGAVAPVSLHNVANGAVTSTSTDAVNGSQLHGLGSDVANSLGGGSTYVNGVWTGPSYTIQGNTYNNVGGALGGINTSLTNINTNVTNLGNDALLWDSAANGGLGAFSAKHGGAGPNIITNVAPGALTSTSTDTVNGSQLYATNQLIGEVASNSVQYDNAGKTSVTLGGSGAVAPVSLHNVANGAVTSTSTDAVNGSQLDGLGSNVAISLGGGSTYVNGAWTGPSYSLTNIASDGSSTTGTYTDVGEALDSLGNSVGNVNTRVDDIVTNVTGLSNDALLWDATANGGSGAFSAKHGSTSSNIIMNVAAGAINATSLDAINGSQLNAFGGNIASYFGGGTSYTNGVWTGPTFSLTSVGTGGTFTVTNYNNVGDALGGLNSMVLNLRNEFINLGSGSPSDSLLWDSAAKGGNGSYSANHGSDGNSVITNVADGDVHSTSKDAVNGSQLNATNEAVSQLDNSSVKYDINSGTGDKTNTITLAGGDPNAPVVISNVAAGTTNTDAANVGQLKDGMSTTLTSANTYTNQVAVNTLQSANNYTDQVASNTLSNANAYTDYRIGQLNQDIRSVRKEARQAAAIGLAASSLRYDDRSGKLSVAAGAGAWSGEGALAMGVGYTSQSGRVRANLSATTAGGKWGIGGGLSFTLN